MNPVFLSGESAELHHLNSSSIHPLFYYREMNKIAKPNFRMECKNKGNEEVHFSFFHELDDGSIQYLVGSFFSNPPWMPSEEPEKIILVAPNPCGLNHPISIMGSLIVGWQVNLFQVQAPWNRQIVGTSGNFLVYGAKKYHYCAGVNHRRSCPP